MKNNLYILGYSSSHFIIILATPECISETIMSPDEIMKFADEQMYINKEIIKEKKEKIGKTKNPGHIKWMMVLMKLIELIINLVKNQKSSLIFRRVTWKAPPRPRHRD